MAKDLPSLGELEIEVLRVVWRQQPCTERQVYDVVRRDRELGRTTVLKTIQRLESKGYVSRMADTGPVQYRAAVAEKRLLPSLVRRFVKGTLAGSLEPFVNYMADSDKLSAKDLAALRSIARKISEQEK